MRFVHQIGLWPIFDVRKQLSKQERIGRAGAALDRGVRSRNTPCGSPDTAEVTAPGALLD